MTDMFEHDPKDVNIVESEDGSVKIGETVYKDKEAAFKGKAEADKHISITQAENKELRDRVKSLEDNQGTALQSLLERMDANQSKDQGVNYDDLLEDSPPKQQSPQFDPDVLKKVVQEGVKQELSIQDQERQVQSNLQVKQANLDKIREALISKCGSKEEAKSAWEEYQSSSSFNPEIYEMQVLKTPDALIEAIAPTQTVNFGNANIPNSRNYSGSNTQAGPKPRSYWAKRMKENPREYFSVESQLKMKDDLSRLGKEKFFDT